MKIGRNAPCPCGSGKKYKKCCLNKAKPPVDLLWRRLGNTHDRLIDKLLAFAAKSFGEPAMILAMGEFLLWPETDFPEDPGDGHIQLFTPWFVFNWVCDPNDPDLSLIMPANQTVAQIYAERGLKLDELERRLIDAAVNRPFSFLEVVSCNPGQGFRLKDVLQGVETDVLEKMGSENARPGDILLGRIVQVDHVAMLVGCSSVLIPPSRKPAIIDLRHYILQENRYITADVLNEYDTEIRDLYFGIYESLLQPPKICNTDGDPMVFHTPEAMLSESPSDPAKAMDQNELMQMPGVREHLAKMVTAHWKGWIDQKLPALGGKTPRKAVQTPDGRESVEALLLDAERGAARDGQMGAIDLAAIEDVRCRLGLDKAPVAKAQKIDQQKIEARLAEIKSKIENFGQARLNELYTGLALKLCNRLARTRQLTIERGRTEIWAAAVVHVIACLNFLFDPENEIYITATEMNAFFGTKKTTVGNKAGLIQEACDIYFGDEEFSAPEICDLFRIYETEEGFLVPGFMADQPDGMDPAGFRFPSDKKIRTGDAKRSRGKKVPDKKKVHATDKKKETDSRQLKLFDDT